MDLRGALKEQFHAGIGMLTECVKRCPNDLWTAPNKPEQQDPANPEWIGVERPYWRIALHAAYFTHLYLGQNAEAFQPPKKQAVGRRAEFDRMWASPWDLEPYELTPDVKPCSQSVTLEYIRYVDSLIDSTVDTLDLDAPESGFGWYKGINKLSHVLLTLRHLQGHVGQLSELLMQRGIDIQWLSN